MYRVGERKKEAEKCVEFFSQEVKGSSGFSAAHSSASAEGPNCLGTEGRRN